MGKGGDLLRFAGQEFGTTTGRPHRCGWLDIVALRYCCQINGFASLNLTKLDVLSDLSEIQLGVTYRHPDGSILYRHPRLLPFKVQDKARNKLIVLMRNYDEETINILVDMPNSRCEIVEDAAVNSEEESEQQPSVPLSVTVSKENGLSLEFDVRAFPNKISICAMSIKERKTNSNQLDYRGPAFSFLNESLHKSLYEYLEVRGLTGSTANFLLEYVICKDTKEYIRWLKNIKNFVEN